MRLLLALLMDGIRNWCSMNRLNLQRHSAPQMHKCLMFAMFPVDEARKFVESIEVHPIGKKIKIIDDTPD